MSVRYEWMHLPHVTYLPPGHDVTTGGPATEETALEEDTDKSSALVLSGDECTVITGTDDQLRQWAVGIVQAIPTREAELDYRTHGDSYSDPPRAAVCTHCGALAGDQKLHTDWHDQESQR